MWSPSLQNCWKDNKKTHNMKRSWSPRWIWLRGIAGEPRRAPKTPIFLSSLLPLFYPIQLNMYVPAILIHSKYTNVYCLFGHICNAKYITHAWVQGRTCSLSSGSLRKPEQNFAGYWSDFIWHHLLLQSNRSHRWVYIDDRCVQCNCNFWGHSSSTVVFVFIPVSFWWSRTLQALPRCSWPGTGTWYISISNQPFF